MMQSRLQRNTLSAARRYTVRILDFLPDETYLTFFSRSGRAHQVLSGSGLALGGAGHVRRLGVLDIHNSVRVSIF